MKNLKERVRKINPTGIERQWSEYEVIVTKTDIKGKIIYANKVFLRLAQLDEIKAIGAPHNIIRHPEMPRCVFKLLWDTIAQGKEIFAFVNNLALGGDHYWVFAHVTPSFDENGSVVGYHSSRRKPTKSQIDKIRPIYNALLNEEKKHTSPKEAIAASTALLLKVLEDSGVSYDEFVLSI